MGEDRDKHESCYIRTQRNSAPPKPARSPTLLTLQPGEGATKGSLGFQRQTAGGPTALAFLLKDQISHASLWGNAPFGCGPKGALGVFHLMKTQKWTCHVQRLTNSAVPVSAAHSSAHARAFSSDCMQHDRVEFASAPPSEPITLTQRQAMPLKRNRLGIRLHRQPVLACRLCETKVARTRFLEHSSDSERPLRRTRPLG